MREIIVQGSIEAVNVVDVPIPIPKADEVVIKVAVAASNPKDFKYPQWYAEGRLNIWKPNSDNDKCRKNMALNSGDDMAGIVHAVGKDVYEFSPGDRVFAYHVPLAEHGSYAEYAVAPQHMTAHLASNVSFEEATTVPTAAMTAALGLFNDLKFPAPWEVDSAALDRPKNAILIYGITSAVGAFAAKLCKLSGIGPIIGVAGRAADYAQALADYVVDYRKGEDAVVSAVKEILAKEGLHLGVPRVFDAVSENGSLEATLRFIDPQGTVSTVLPPELFAKAGKEYVYPEGVKGINTAVPTVFSSHKEFGYIWFRYLAKLLADGRLKGHPYEVVDGGLRGVLAGLQRLRAGEASGSKFVYRIEDTSELAEGLIEQADPRRDSGAAQKRVVNFPSMKVKS
jgi:NADPH:quinone reductase